MRLVENSYYQHAEYGLVKLIDVTNGVVSMQKQEGRPVNVGGKRIPAGKKQSAAGFQSDAEPADIAVDANVALFGATGVEQ